MHTVIDIVVEAQGIESAVEEAKSFFDENLLYKNGGPFDYCTPMVSGEGVSGSDRWTQYEEEPLAYPLSTDAGQEEVRDAWESTLSDFDRSLEDVWEAFENADDIDDFRKVLLNEEDLIRHKMNHLAAYSSHDHNLYVPSWSHHGIRGYPGWEYVQELIEETKENALHDEDTRYVVPLDVHF